MMDKKKRTLFTLTFVLGLLGVGMLVASLATDYWLESHPVRNVGDDALAGARNVTGGDLDTKFTGFIHFGLFKGSKSLDYGYGVRTSEISVEDYADAGVFDFGLWVSTVLMVVLALVWGLVSMGFAILNITTRPIETLTGPLGLYLWNGLAFAFSVSSFLLYLGLFLTELSANVLLPADTQQGLFTSDGRSHLSYSFYLVVGAACMYLLNVIVLLSAGARCQVKRYSADVNDKAMDGVMMY